MVCVCVCYWPPFHEVFPNYQVVMFQPRALTTPDLDSVAYFYMAYLLNPPHPLFLPSNFRQGEEAHSCPTTPAINLSPHGIILPPRRHPSPSQHTKILSLPLLHRSLPESESSSPLLPPPCLMNYRRLRSLAASKISFNVAFICFSPTACRQNYYDMKEHL